MNKTIEFLINKINNGERLDVFLSKEIKNLTRSYIKKLIEKNNVKLIGANPEAIELAEDRQKFKDAMREIGLNCPESEVVEELSSALEVKEKLKFKHFTDKIFIGVK